MFEIHEIPAHGGAAASLIAGFVLFTMQYIKKIPPLSHGRGKDFLPLTAAVLGAVSAVVYTIVFEGLSADAAHVAQAAAQGFITGLTACGTFDFVKCTFMGKARKV